MPVKRPEILSREDFAEALREARVTVAEVAKATGVPRTYMSEFRNGDRQLRPEMLAKLREFFEAKGIEFEPEPDPESTLHAGPGDIPTPGTVAGPRPGLGAHLVAEAYFPISKDIPESVRDQALDWLELAHARLAVLMPAEAKRERAMFSEGDWTDETRAQLEEACGLLAASHVVFLTLTGWRGFAGAQGGTPGGTGGKTVAKLREVLFASFADSLAETGLFPEGPETPEDETEDEHEEHAA